MKTLPPKVPGVDGGGGSGSGSGAQNGWGLWNIVKDAAAAVTPSGVAPQGGFGDLNGGGMMTNGGANAAPGFSPDLKLPDGKRLAYRPVLFFPFLFIYWINLKGLSHKNI